MESVPGTKPKDVRRQNCSQLVYCLELPRAALLWLTTKYSQFVNQYLFLFPEWARGKGILRHQRSHGAIKVRARGWKDTKGRSGCRPAYRTWDRKRSFAGLKHRLGRANDLPGVPWYYLRMMGGWKTRGRAQALGKGGTTREMKPNSTEAAMRWRRRLLVLLKPARLSEECNAIGHREAQVCDKADLIDRRLILWGWSIEFAKSASGDECGIDALINQERAIRCRVGE